MANGITHGFPQSKDAKATRPLNAFQEAGGGKNWAEYWYERRMQTGRPKLLRFASPAGKTAGDIAGLHEATFHNRRFRRTPRDGMDSGLAEVTGGAIAAGRQLRLRRGASYGIIVFPLGL
jgi:hypothetical protein